MRVAINSIVDEGIQIEEDIEAEAWDMDSFDVKFVDKIHIKCDFSKAGGEILVKAYVVTHRLILCSRCMEEATQVVVQNFDFHYSITSLGDYLEMDNDIREELLLNFPMKVLCKPNCKGICPGCGVNLNHQECKC
jgi:uncharacterized protein